MPTGVDDTGQQGKGPGADGGAGAVAEAAGDDPMAQRTLGRVVGQRQFRVRKHAEDGVPVVEELNG